MFDFAWSELALIGVVALVAIGPKDMPVAIKTVAGLVKKARRMAGDFQVHVDDLMKEANLSEMKTHLSDLRSLNIRDTVAKAVDPDGALRATLADRPFAQPGAQPGRAGTPMADLDNFVPAYPTHMMGDHTIYAPAPAASRLDPDSAPPFIPPEAVAAARTRQSAPAFIPPDCT